MTTWLPAVCLLWVVFWTVMMATDPAFTRGSDHLVGAAAGFISGGVSAVIFYVVVRLIDFLA